MRRVICFGVLMAVCSGCASQPPPQPVISQVTTTTAADDPNCREYTAEATVGGEPQQIVGRACRQSDGSWRVVEGTPEQPAQVVTVYTPPPYPYYPYYPYYDPWFWGPPFGFGFGASFAFIGGHHHHRGFHHGGGGGGGGGHHHR